MKAAITNESGIKAVFKSFAVRSSGKATQSGGEKALSKLDLALLAE